MSASRVRKIKWTEKLTHIDSGPNMKQSERMPAVVSSSNAVIHGFCITGVLCPTTVSAVILTRQGQRFLTCRTLISSPAKRPSPVISFPILVHYFSSMLSSRGPLAVLHCERRGVSSLWQILGCKVLGQGDGPTDSPILGGNRIGWPCDKLKLRMESDC